MKNYLEIIKDMYKLKDLIIEGILVSFTFTFLDIFNIPSLLIENNCIALIILFLLFILINLFSKSDLNLLKSKNVNIIDKMSVNVSVAIVFLFLYVIILDYKLYKIILLIVFSVIQMAIAFMRIKYVNSINCNSGINVLDLKFICNNKIDLSDKKLVLLEEKDVDYDLLNRKDIINQLYNTIINCNPETNFTIGLNGSWGSGKTTVINNVLRIIKQNNILNNYVVVRFDPWKYNEEKVMLHSFLTEILKQTNYGLSSKNNESLIQEVINAIFGTKITGIGKIIIEEIRNIKGNVEISKIVNNYLLSNNKKLLIIIDNLDRIDANKAFFLIKCIESIVKFNRTINILLYDEEILNKILKEKFNYEKNYMDKLVQLKIDVPETDKFTINNIKEKITQNLLVEGKPFVSFINNEQYDFSNMRELKRYVNSIITSNFNSNSKLNKKDDSNLKYLKSVCPQLFYEIWNNKKYFITYDRQYDADIYTWDYKKLNIEAKDYFDKLFQNESYSKHIGLLEKMFPSVNNYMKEQVPFDQSTNIEDYHKSIIDCSICNARYFDLYFTREENDFIRLNSDVEKLIQVINHENDFLETFKEIILNYNADELKVFAEVLNLNISKISTNKYLNLIETIFNLGGIFKDRILAFELDSSQRFNIIVSDLLIKITKEEFEKLKLFVKSDYRRLKRVYNIKYWVDNNKNKNIKYNFDFDELYKDFCEDILNNDVDIYLAKNYIKGNIWALYHYSEERTQKYIEEKINKKNIYYFLADIISVSVGTKNYGYRIAKENINILAPNLDIDKFISEKGKKLNDKEKFIKEVYDFYKSENKGFEDGIYKEYYIEL